MNLRNLPILCSVFLCSLVFSQDNTICVSLVVKNNEATIHHCLNSIASIASCVSICDGGSTDETKRIIEDFFRITGIPGKIHQREFQDLADHRAIAVTAAQKTLKSCGFPLSRSYLLLLEPDQIVTPDLAFTESLVDDSYLVLEKSATLSCYRYAPRLFRASLSAEDIGHPIWNRAVKKVRTLLLEEKLPDFIYEEEELTEEERKTLFKDHQDQCKKEKLEKNLERYTQALQSDPEDLNALLQLAHTYKALEQYDAAIEFYQKRIAKGGDPEAVWFSTYLIGECQEEKGLWVHALYWYLEAYQLNPRRAESLRKIATHYRLAGESDLAYLFAKHGWRIPKAADPHLFPLPPLSDYQFDEEISISAYYTRFKDEGYAASNDLLLRKDTPPHIREQGYRNLLFYIQNLKARYVPIHIPLPLVCLDADETYYPMNPSIHKTPRGYKLICRSVNYTQTGAKHFHTNDKEGIFRTRNFLVHYDRSFNKIAQHEILEDLDRPHHRTYIVQGLEDCRIFEFQGASWFTCSTFDTNPSGAIQISLCKMKEETFERPVKVEKLLPLKGPDPNRHEKNWLPFVKDNELHFIYSSDPFILYKPDLETGDCQTLLEYTPEHDFSRFRGSAPPIPFDSGYLMLIHEVVQLPDYTRSYVHRFVFLDAQFTLTKVSKPFTFNHTGIEYCLSMTLDHEEKQLIMPIGIEDHEAYLAFVELDQVRALLQPLPPIYSPF